MRSPRKRKRNESPPPCVGCGGNALDHLATVPLSDEADGLTIDTKIRPVRGIQQAGVGDQLVVLEPVTGRRVLLNGTAALILTAFDKERSVGNIVSQLAQETRSDPKQIAPDVIATIDQLCSQGMLTRGEPEDHKGLAHLRSSHSERLVESTDAMQWAFQSTTRRIADVSFVVRIDERVSAPPMLMLIDTIGSAGDDAAPHTIELISADHGQLDTDQVSVRALIDGVAWGAPFEPHHLWALLFDALDELLVNNASGLRFHAGAVEQSGKVVVILGQSGFGKSTLTGALTQRGFRYLTDELVIVSGSDFVVAPYARPFDLDDASCALLAIGEPDVATGREKGKVASDRLGATSLGGRAALVVLLTGEDRHDDAVLVEKYPPERAVMSLLPLTFAQSFDDPDALENLAALCMDTRIIRMRRGPLEEMVAAIEHELGSNE